MSSKVYCILVNVLGMLQLIPSPPVCVNTATVSGLAGTTHALTPDAPPNPAQFSKSLRFNTYTFTVSATDRGAVRELRVKAYRGSLLLTNFRIRVDGTVGGAEVADLDNNRFPELYVYSASTGGNSFGRVYAWQFLPERKVGIVPVNWPLKTDGGYMGHDSLWIERTVLCREYPIYRPGDDMSNPSGGIRMMRYQLKPIGTGFALVAEPE